MAKRAILVLLVSSLLALLGAAPASAQYTPGQTAFVLSPSFVGPGDTVFATGTGCPAGSTVEVIVEGAIVATGTAGSGSGSFEVSFIAPLTPGEYVISVICGGVTVNQFLSVGVSSCGFIVQGLPGSQVTVNVAGFKIGAPYTLRFDPMGRSLGAGTIAADPQTFSFQIPLDAAAGEYELVIESLAPNDASRVIRCEVQVLQGATTTIATTGALPITGSDAANVAKTGLALLAIGGLLLVATRRSTRRIATPGV